jgi:hypothetical protein
MTIIGVVAARPFIQSRLLEHALLNERQTSREEAYAAEPGAL